MFGDWCMYGMVPYTVCTVRTIQYNTVDAILITVFYFMFYCSFHFGPISKEREKTFSSGGSELLWLKPEGLARRKDRSNASKGVVRYHTIQSTQQAVV